MRLFEGKVEGEEKRRKGKSKILRLCQLLGRPDAQVFNISVWSVMGLFWDSLKALIDPTRGTLCQLRLSVTCMYIRSVSHVPSLVWRVFKSSIICFDRSSLTGQRGLFLGLIRFHFIYTFKVVCLLTLNFSLSQQNNLSFSSFYLFVVLRWNRQLAS